MRKARPRSRGLTSRSNQTSSLVGVDQTRHASADAGNQPGELLCRSSRLTSSAMQPLFELVTHALGVRQQRTDILPHRSVQKVGAALLVAADPLAAEAIGITAHAAIIGIIAPPALATGTAQGLAVVGIAAVPADQQALKQVATATSAFAPTPTILLQLFRHRG